MIVGLSNTLLTLSRPKKLIYFNKTPIIPSRLNTRHLLSRNSMPCPLTHFGQNSTTLSQLSTRRSSRKPSLEVVPWPSPYSASSSPSLHPCQCQEQLHPATPMPMQTQLSRLPPPLSPPSADPAPPLTAAAALPEKTGDDDSPLQKGRPGCQGPDQGLIETCLGLN